MDTWWIPLLYGGAGYIVATIVHTVLVRGTVPREHQRYRDHVLGLLHRRINLEAELADVDHELATTWEKAPSAQAKLIVQSVERARTLPRRFRQLARAFGFDMPDPDMLEPVLRQARRQTFEQVELEQQPTSQPRPVLRAVGDDSAPPGGNAWGGG